MALPGVNLRMITNVSNQFVNFIIMLLIVPFQSGWLGAFAHSAVSSLNK